MWTASGPERRRERRGAEVTTGGFDAEEDGARTDGSVTNALLGAGFRRESWLAGLALGFSRSEGDYAQTATGVGHGPGVLTPHAGLSLKRGPDAQVADRDTLEGAAGGGARPRSDRRGTPGGSPGERRSRARYGSPGGAASGGRGGPRASKPARVLAAV